MVTFNQRQINDVLSSAILMFALLVTAPAYAAVVVSNPTNGQTVSPDVQFVASANTSTCSKGVAALGIYVDDGLNYQVNGTNLNTNLHLGSGSHRVVVVGWDYCGGATSAQVNLNVSGTAGVSVISPANGSTVGSPVAFSATATSSCPQGVAAMGVYVNNQLCLRDKRSIVEYSITPWSWYSEYGRSGVGSLWRKHDSASQTQCRGDDNFRCTGQKRLEPMGPASSGLRHLFRSVSWSNLVDESTCEFRLADR